MGASTSVNSDRFNSELRTLIHLDKSSWGEIRNRRAISVVPLLENFVPCPHGKYYICASVEIELNSIADLAVFFCRSSTILFLFCLSWFGLLAGCADNSTVEGWFAPDPRLKEQSPQTSSSSPNPDTPTGKVPAKLPTNFPSDIPLYPQAKLLDTELELSFGGEITRWQSADSSDDIAAFYQRKFQEKNWETIQALTVTNGDRPRTMIVRQEDVEVTLLLSPPDSTESSSSTFEIWYKWDEKLAGAPTAETPLPATPSEQSFADLDLVPELVRQQIDDLAALSIFAGDRESENNQSFKPNQVITRSEFARWLLAANNAIYANIPSKQIRPIPKATQPAFKDIPATDPHFAVIQGLAEAGLVPSPLTGNSSALLFRPDAPLTRETLLLWKVPLDARQALPKTSLDALQATWGFQDTAKIDPQVWRSLLADFQNGEQANVRRAFGYTQLFQPQKTVTRAEAAAALWYFGWQGEGVTAREALKLQPDSN